MQSLLKLLVMTFICTIPAQMNAEDPPTMLIISMTNGIRQTVMLSDRPLVSFNNSQLLVKKGQTEISLELDKIRDFTYSSTNALTSVGISDSFIREGDNLIFSGNGQKLDITLTSVAGIILKTATIASGETSNLSLSDLESGVYILTVNGISSKILKQ